MTAIGGGSYAEPMSDLYLVGVTFPAPDRVGDSRESLFFHGVVAVTFVCIVGVLGSRCTDCNSFLRRSNFYLADFLPEPTILSFKELC